MKNNILIVEDDPSLSEVYYLILSNQGFNVQTASNGLKALQSLKSFNPDIILLDYFMPVMDGKTFLKNFDESQHPGIKIIIATNISDQATLDEMLRLGAHSHFLKAELSPAQLVEIITKELE